MFVERDQIESWKAEVCALLAIPEERRTSEDQIRLWARRVRLLGNGWRVVLHEGVPTFRYIGNAAGFPEWWDELLKERFEYVGSRAN